MPRGKKINLEYLGDLAAGPNKGRQGVAGVAWHGFTVRINAKPTYDELLDKWEVAQENGYEWDRWKKFCGRSHPTAWLWQVKRIDPQPTRAERYGFPGPLSQYMEGLCNRPKENSNGRCHKQLRTS